MIKLVIITGICFVVGNVTWPLFGEQKVFYIPQALFFICLIKFAKDNTGKDSKCLHLFLTYLLLLSCGNLIKQAFYTDTIKQINDYFWGGLVTAWLLINLKMHSKWATRKTVHGGRK